MKTSILYHKKSRNSIEDDGYELNPYDSCVTNNITKGIQMTVCSHVDDYKLIHKNPKVVGKRITYLKQEHESIFEDGSVEMMFHWYKVHNYLWMTLDYTEGSTVRVSMIYYIDKIIAAFDKV